MKKRIFLLIIVINLFILSGCWNYKDINQTRLVAGMALDYDKEKDEYITTIEIINPKAEKGQMTGELYQSTGKMPFDGIRDIIMKTGRKLYFAHTKTVIISEDIAKERIIPILDYIYRDAEWREDLRLIVSKEKTAREILESYVDRKIYPVTGYFLDKVIESQSHTGKYHCAQTWRFIKSLYAEGVSPTLPAIKNIEMEGKIKPILNGLAVFKGDKMAGYLDELETQGFLWVIDYIKGGLVIVESKMGDEPKKVTLEILKSKTKVKPLYKEGQLLMKIDIETDVNIGEIGGSEDFIEKKGRALLKKDAEKQIEKQVEAVIKKVQKNYNSDIFKFSTSIKKEMPDLWKEIKPNWDEVFKDLKTEVDVTINIRGSALTSKPIQVAK